MESRISIVTFLVLCTARQAFSYDCTAAGRYADTSDTTCQTYYLCVYDSSTTSYTSYTYTCPSTSVFNSNTSQCTDSSNYNCTNTNSTSSVCTSEGYIADPDSTNCTTYIECTEVNGTYIETSYTCPDNTYYDPNTTYCESDYNCTSSSDSDSTFTCTSAGRFANSTDTTCKTYYYCVYDSSTGTYLQYEYTCTGSSVFSPTAKLCTTSYTCGS